jgi:glycosyltransferase involved in cell wall biosynthesis
MIKKNIAIVITRLDLGGAQRVALELAGRLDKKKFNVHLICGPGGILDNEAKAIKNINLFFMEELVHPIHLGFDLIAWFRLKKYFENNKIDVVHTHSSKAGLLGRLAAFTASNKPVIMHTIHGFPFHEFQNPAAHFIYLALERFIAGFTDKMIAVGSDVVEYGIKNMVGTPDKYTVIRAGVDLKQFKAMTPKLKAVQRSGFLKKHGLNPALFTIGMIGNLKKQKNPLAFVEIARRVCAKDKTIQFVFAGGGPMKERIDKLILKYKLAGNVKFIGWCSEPEKMMNSIDLFLLTSLWEGLPCTLVQAASAGVPALASDIDGNREFINTTKSGSLYSPYDYDFAADMVISAKLKKSILKVRKTVLKEFDAAYMVKQHEQIYITSHVNQIKAQGV